MDQYGVMTTVFVLHEVLSLLLSGKDKTACKADKMQPFVSSVFKRVLIMVDSEYVLKTVVSPSPSYDVGIRESGEDGQSSLILFISRRHTVGRAVELRTFSAFDEGAMSALWKRLCNGLLLVVGDCTVLKGRHSVRHNGRRQRDSQRLFLRSHRLCQIERSSSSFLLSSVVVVGQGKAELSLEGPAGAGSSESSVDGERLFAVQRRHIRSLHTVQLPMECET